MSALRRLRDPLFCALFFLCFSLSLQNARSLQKLPELCTLSFGASSLSGQEAADMAQREREEEMACDFVLWGEKSGQTAENPELGRSAEVKSVLLYGSSSLLFPSTAPLAAGDTEGCLVDSSTAWQLFGSTAPIGSKLEFGGRKLTVRGILDTDRPLLLAEAAGKERELNYVTLRVPKGVPAGKAREEFAARHGLSGNWDASGTPAALAGTVSLAPAFLLLLSVLFFLVKTGFSCSEFPVPFGVCLLAAGAVWFLLLWLTEFSFSIPEEYLPGKWSDFDFWGELWTQKKSELLTFLITEKTEFALIRLLPALRACGFGLCALLLFFISLRRLYPVSGKGLWLWCAFSLLLAFGSSLFLGRDAAGSRLLWLCLPAYFSCRFLASRLAEWAAAIRKDYEAALPPRRYHFYRLGRRSGQ